MIVRRNQSFPSNLESHSLSWSVKARGAKRPAHRFLAQTHSLTHADSVFFVREFKKSGMGGGAGGWGEEGGGTGLFSDAINVLTEQLSNVPWSHLHWEGGDFSTALSVSHATCTTFYFMSFKLATAQPSFDWHCLCFVSGLLTRTTAKSWSNNNYNKNSALANVSIFCSK